jgi:hypothetical protein
VLFGVCKLFGDNPGVYLRGEFGTVLGCGAAFRLGASVSRSEEVSALAFASSEGASAEGRPVGGAVAFTPWALWALLRALRERSGPWAIGAGGFLALILHRGGTPYRGFLEGRTQGDKYCLVLHLSNMELRAPEAPPA